MSRIVRQIATLAVGVVIVAGADVRGQESHATRLEGQRLADALKTLQDRGLKIIYSSEAVQPDMRVRAEPRATSLRQILDELLSPHGLIARDGPAGTVLIVKDRRARPRGVVRPEKPQPSPPGVAVVAAAEGVEPTRFEETITVSNSGPGTAPAGPPPLALRPLDARGFAGVFDNLFRMLQALPGVAAAQELGSRIAVRGGSPDQNLTIIDGIEIHNPYRLYVPFEDLGIVGLASTVNPETINSVALFPGAFDVRHGDRLSSLLVVTNREGSDAEPLQGFAFMSLTDANVILEGKLPDRANGSWLLTSRRTYFDLLAERVIGEELPSFEDVQARVSSQPRPGQRASFVGVLGREQTRPRDSVASDERHSTRTDNHLLALTFESSVGSSASSRTVASFSRFADSLGAYERSFDDSRGANTPDSISSGGLLQYQLARDVAVRDVAARQEFVFVPSARHWLDLGFETHGLDTRWAWTISGDRSLDQANGSSVRLGASLLSALDSSVDSYRFGAWVQDRIEVSPRLVLQPGLRWDHSSLTGEATFSPRLSGALALGQALRLDAAVRLHSQTPGYEKLFQSDYFIDLSGGARSNLKAERALQAVAGLERDFGGGLSARVDVYYKRFSNLLVGRLETDEEREARVAGYDVPAALWTSVPTRAEITTAPLNAGTGRASGMDVRVAHTGKRSLAPLTWWAAYSFGRASRTAYGVTRPFDYDRRHAVSVAANLKIGSRLDLSASGRWATGFPRTPVRGVRLALVADADDVDGDGNREERVPQLDRSGHPIFQPDLGDFSNFNSARLPRYARLDTRLTYRPTWAGERWELYLDLINVFNARNVIQIDSALVLDPTSDRPGIVEAADDRGMPVFPSIGIRVWF
jgi:hypothetical protein